MYIQSVSKTNYQQRTTSFKSSKDVVRDFIKSQNLPEKLKKINSANPEAQKMFVMDSTKHASNQALLCPTYEA